MIYAVGKTICRRQRRDENTTTATTTLGHYGSCPQHLHLEISSLRRYVSPPIGCVPTKPVRPSLAASVFRCAQTQNMRAEHSHLNHQASVRRFCMRIMFAAFIRPAALKIATNTLRAPNTTMPLYPRPVWSNISVCVCCRCINRQRSFNIFISCEHGTRPILLLLLLLVLKDVGS